MAMYDGGTFSHEEVKLNYDHVQLVDMENFKLMLELDASLEVEIVPNVLKGQEVEWFEASFNVNGSSYYLLKSFDIEDLQGVDFIVINYINNGGSKSFKCTLQGWRRKNSEAC